jgi:UBX domain-containing protein 1
MFSSIGAGRPPVVDDSAPTTVLQIRLSNGKREKVKLNRSHTVGDMINYISSVSPAESFVILAGFPPKRMEDTSLTLEAAGLLNAAVQQQLS